MKVYFFGCWDGVGHYLFESRYNRPSFESIPWGTDIDGGLAPAGVKQRQGVAELHHKDGWTALSWWDRSIDHRSNSNAAILAEGTHNYDEMIQLGKDHFPEIMGRFEYPLIEVQRPD